MFRPAWQEHRAAAPAGPPEYARPAGIVRQTGSEARFRPPACKMAGPVPSIT